MDYNYNAYNFIDNNINRLKNRFKIYSLNIKGGFMKKIFLSLIAIIAVISLTGCKIKEKHGDSFEVSLYTNSSARINWDYKLSKDDIVEVSYNYDDSGCDPKAVGCGGQGIYTITALKPGKVKLTFECANDGMCEPMENLVYEITVNDDLAISETHNEEEDK